MTKFLQAKKCKIGTAKQVTDQRKIVLVGTYAGDQLKDWPGYYPYPLSADDKVDPEYCKNVNEIWLFKGTKEPKYFAAEYLGVKTRDELKVLGYPAKGKGHGDGTYLLFKIVKTYAPANASAALSVSVESVIVRTKDFARTPTVRKQLKDFLESADRNDKGLASQLPSIVLKLPREVLRVCESFIQMDFFQIIGACYDKPIPFPSLEHPNFTFIDLFAGIGGFHLAMHRLGGKCVFASEWDKSAQETYAQNYGIIPRGDITKIGVDEVPDHDVLCAGFPCQPFSKAGKQLGFDDETKGTLFFDIERILRSKIDKGHPTRYIVLENVRNLVSHDSGKTWNTISSHLKNLGYRLTLEPLIVSPHYFGIPQLRERVLILGAYEPQNINEPLIVDLPQFMRKEDCDVHEILEDGEVAQEYYLNDQEVAEIDMWDEFYRGIKETVLGFPVWAEYFSVPPDDDMPEWKQEFVRKNNALYLNNKQFIDGWLRRHNNLEDVTPTMRKLEWQVGDNAESLWDCLMQKRPSGLRVKRTDCAPALVAIVQVPIIGPHRRRMTVREAARLQSFPDDFIPNPVMHEAYKQFGNAVNVEVVRICSASLFQHGEQPIIPA